MQGAATADLAPGYGAYLLQTTLALIAVCVLAALVLWLLRRRGVGGSRGLRVIERLTLEPRRSVYVIEAAGKFLLVGVGDGPMAVLAELDPARVQNLEDEAAAGQEGLADLAKRLLGRGGPSR